MASQNVVCFLRQSPVSDLWWISKFSFSFSCIVLVIQRENVTLDQLSPRAFSTSLYWLWEWKVLTLYLWGHLFLFYYLQRDYYSRLHQMANVNLYHVTKFSPYFLFTFYFFDTKISSFMPVFSIRIILDCFYLLIFYSEKFSTWIWSMCAVYGLI